MKTTEIGATGPPPSTTNSARAWLPAVVALWCCLLATLTLAGPAGAAAPVRAQTAQTWITAVTTAPQVQRGATAGLTVTVTAPASATALVDLEIYSGSTKVFQRYWDDESFAPGTARTLTASWNVPATAAAGTYRVKLGVFNTGWNGLVAWNDTAATITVTAPPPPTTTTLPPTTTTTPPTTTPAHPTTTTPPPTTTTPPGGSWATSATAPASAAQGTAVSIAVGVTSRVDGTALVDVEIYDGNRKAYQQVWDAQAFAAGQTRTFTATWTIPGTEPLGARVVKIGVFSNGWATQYIWNNAAASFQVVAGSGATPTSSSVAPTTTTPGSGAHFGLLPVGASLPSDATCAARVRPAAEVRPANQAPNHTVGSNPVSGGLFGRVTGNFVGTTDEIIQWAACKWGIDEDYVRAQVAVESWWRQGNLGDFGTDPSRCVPGHGLGADGQPGRCPESAGLMQVRYPYSPAAFPSAATSSAYNLDYALAARRSCFEGNETWLNTVERGRQYAAGDIWGCMGVWFSGRWYTQPSVDYIGRVQGYLGDRVWESSDFLGG